MRNWEFFGTFFSEPVLGIFGCIFQFCKNGWLTDKMYRTQQLEICCWVNQKIDITCYDIQLQAKLYFYYSDYGGGGLHLGDTQYSYLHVYKNAIICGSSWQRINKSSYKTPWGVQFQLLRKTLLFKNTCVSLSCPQNSKNWHNIKPKNFTFTTKKHFFKYQFEYTKMIFNSMIWSPIKLVP